MFDALLSVILVAGPLVIIYQAAAKNGYMVLKAVGFVSWYHRMCDKCMGSLGLSNAKSFSENDHDQKKSTNHSEIELKSRKQTMEKVEELDFDPEVDLDGTRL